MRRRRPSLQRRFSCHATPLSVMPRVTASSSVVRDGVFRRKFRIFSLVFSPVFSLPSSPVLTPASDGNGMTVTNGSPSTNRLIMDGRHSGLQSNGHQIEPMHTTSFLSMTYQLCERFSPSSAGYSSNRNYAQNGTYFMYFRPVSGLRGRISLASRVSLMTREATALLFSEIPKRPRKVLFIIGSCCTYFRQACR